MFDLPASSSPEEKLPYGGGQIAPPFGGYSTLTHYQYERLKTLFERVYISTKSADKFPFCTDCILDPDGADYAPTAGLSAPFGH
jgi:hypothetical protein